MLKKGNADFNAINLFKMAMSRTVKLDNNHQPGKQNKKFFCAAIIKKLILSEKKIKVFIGTNAKSI